MPLISRVLDMSDAKRMMLVIRLRHSNFVMKFPSFLCPPGERIIAITPPSIRLSEKPDSLSPNS